MGADVEGMRANVELMLVDFCGVSMDQISNRMAKIHYESGANVRVRKGVMTAAIRSDDPVVCMFRKGVMGLAWMAKNKRSIGAVPEDYHSFDLSGEIVATITEHSPTLLTHFSRLRMPDTPIP